MKKLFIACLLGATLTLGIAGCGQSQSQSQPAQDSSKAQQSQQSIQEEFGTVQPESAETLVAKFNTEVMDNSNGEMNPASTDFLTENGGQYWYGLVEGVYLVVIPEQFTGNQANDIVNAMMIYVGKNTGYLSWALPYATYLIEANNPEITAEQADALLAEAKSIADTEDTAISGKGITVGYRETEDMYQYQVIRVNG